jgi:ubiquinone/menaquinone biosynthesis C-methylase UbiE
MLACPRCDKALDADGAMLSCAGCKIDFPTLSDVPFLWSEPTAAMADWRNRWSFALAELDAQLDASKPKPNLPEATKARLDHLSEGLRHYRAELLKLLEPLALGDAHSLPHAQATHLALRTTLPRHHHVLSYMANVHRDWCWGEAENQRTLDVIAESLEMTEAGRQSVLVLGAGAGRLAYDLHRHLAPEATYAVDSNPLLCLLASRVSHGGAVRLTEFPIAPVSSDESAVARELSAEPAHEGLRFICADALRAPFAKQSFDLVVTPWLIDVIDAPFDALSLQVARLLRVGGAWVNHGSLAFAGAPASRLTVEEVADTVTSAGFALRDRRDTELPYLHSPASRQRRYEITHTFAAELERAPKAKAISRHKHLPDWIVVGNSPIPLSRSFETQITTTRIHAFIMSLIDGKRSLNDMATVLEEQRLMPRADAVQAIRSFLTTMFEEAAQVE